MNIRLMTASLAVALVANVATGQEMPAGIDADSDGSVSVQEFATYAATRLPGEFPTDKFAKQVDADGDGIITQAEFDGRRDVLENMSNPEPQAEEASAETGALKAGDMAADFELQSIGQTIKLSDITAKGKTVVVVFSRANW